MAIKKPTTDEAVREIREVRDQLDGDLSIVELTEALSQLHDLSGAKLEGSYQEEYTDHHGACLKKSLQAAVTLEFATIPPYLCALWSIKNELDPAAASIREVVQEEMLHMALACNMLASLGETPKINSAVPQYPSGLPGGVHKGLTVDLLPLSKESLAGFLWIERPVEQVPIENPYKEATEVFDLGKLDKAHPQDETIGHFYDTILEAFKVYVSNPRNPPLTPDNQVSGPLAWTVIRDIETVKYAIGLIQEQGEGSKNDPQETNGDLSHYYRFLEVYNGEKYHWNEKTKKLEVVGKLKWPEAWPMARIPKGGYQQEDVSKEVWYYLDEFDKVYSELLDQLQAAWTVGGQASLVCAYGTMFGMEKYAKPLMKTPTPFGGGETYGPCFRYKAS